MGALILLQSASTAVTYLPAHSVGKGHCSQDEERYLNSTLVIVMGAVCKREGTFTLTQGAQGVSQRRPDVRGEQSSSPEEVMMRMG